MIFVGLSCTDVDVDVDGWEAPVPEQIGSTSRNNPRSIIPSAT